MKTVNSYIKQLCLPMILVGMVSILAGCNNRSGLLNGGRNFNNLSYNDPRNPNYYAGMGDAVGYLVYGQSSNVGLTTGRAGNPNPRAGNIAGGTNGSVGGVAGGTLGTPCTFKVAAASPSNYIVGSTQNFAQRFSETSRPSGGRAVYAPVSQMGVTCTEESEVAATANAFYITPGKTGDYVTVYKVNSVGAFYSTQTIFLQGGPTKISATPSGHVAVVHNGGHSLTFFREDRLGGDYSAQASNLHTKNYPSNEIIADIAIDQRQGGLYVITQVGGGLGKVYVYNLNQAFYGQFNPLFSSYDYLNQPNYSNFTFNQDETVYASAIFQNKTFTKLKNFDGLTGIMTNAGRPMFLKTVLDLPAASSEEEIAQQNQDAVATEIRLFDPFEVSYHQQSEFTQPQGAIQYVDFAIGNNLAYMLEKNGRLSTIFVDEHYPFDASTPMLTQTNVGRANSIEMSYDQQYAVVTGSSGLAIGRSAGNNIIFSSTGMPDISESGSVISAAVLAKTTRQAPVAQPAATATAAAVTPQQ